MNSSPARATWNCLRKKKTRGWGDDFRSKALPHKQQDLSFNEHNYKASALTVRQRVKTGNHYQPEGPLAWHKKWPKKRETLSQTRERWGPAPDWDGTHTHTTPCHATPTHTHTYTYIHAWIHTHTHTYTDINIYTYMPGFIHTYTQTHVYTIYIYYIYNTYIQYLRKQNKMFFNFNSKICNLCAGEQKWDRG